MTVIGPPAEEGGGEDTDFVAFVNGLVDVRKEGFDALRKLRVSAHERSRYELARAGQRQMTIAETDWLGNVGPALAAGAAAAPPLAA